MPLILIALDTPEKLWGKGERTMPLENVFKGPNQTVLENG